MTMYVHYPRVVGSVFSLLADNCSQECLLRNFGLLTSRYASILDSEELLPERYCLNASRFNLASATIPQFQTDFKKSKGPRVLRKSLVRRSWKTWKCTEVTYIFALSNSTQPEKRECDDLQSSSQSFCCHLFPHLLQHYTCPHRFIYLCPFLSG